MTHVSETLAALSEGLCTEGHELTPVYLHGVPQASCFNCGCSWLVDENGQLGGCACVPGDHTCGERDAGP
ncbi:MAG TPA: hypothetical protein VF506_01790 [Streptosporangiaceae bacterium]